MSDINLTDNSSNCNPNQLSDVPVFHEPIADSKLEQFDQTTIDNKGLLFEKSKPQKLCCLQVRNIGVTKNNITVMFLFYFVYSLSSWINSFNVFFIENNLLGGKGSGQTDSIQQTNRIIGYIVQLPIVLSSGIIYDTTGRRKPLLLAFSLSSIALIVYPFQTNRFAYYFVSALVVPLTAIAQIPFIPDLIREEGQPVAILITLVFLAVGKVFVSAFLSLVSNVNIPVHSTEVYVFVGLLMALYAIYAFFAMKDVVKSKDFEVRRLRSNTQQANTRISYILKQGLKSIMEEPQIIFGIAGLTQADQLANVFTGTTNQAVVQNRESKCAMSLSTNDCMSSSTTFAIKFIADFSFLTIILGIPFALIITRLSQTKYIQQIFLVETLVVFLIGAVFVLRYDDIGDPSSLVLGGFLGAFDISTAVLCQSMIFQKLLPDSRGTVTSFILVSTTVFGIIQSLLTEGIQSLFPNDFIKGGQTTFSVYIITQGLLSLSVIIWQCKVCFTKKKNDGVMKTQIR